MSKYFYFFSFSPIAFCSVLWYNKEKRGRTKNTKFGRSTTYRFFKNSDRIPHRFFDFLGGLPHRISKNLGVEIGVILKFWQRLPHGFFKNVGLYSGLIFFLHFGRGIFGMRFLKILNNGEDSFCWFRLIDESF